MLPVTSTRNALPRAGWALSVTCSVPPDLLHGMHCTLRGPASCLWWDLIRTTTNSRRVRSASASVLPAGAKYHFLLLGTQGALQWAGALVVRPKYHPAFALRWSHPSSASPWQARPRAPTHQLHPRGRPPAPHPGTGPTRGGGGENQGYDLACQTTRPGAGLAAVWQIC